MVQDVNNKERIKNIYFFIKDPPINHFFFNFSSLFKIFYAISMMFSFSFLSTIIKGSDN